MISVILSNHEFISFITNNIENSSKLFKFLWILKYAIQYTKMKPNDNCLIILNKAKIHLSEQTTEK